MKVICVDNISPSSSLFSSRRDIIENDPLLLVSTFYEILEQSISITTYFDGTIGNEINTVYEILIDNKYCWYLPNRFVELAEYRNIRIKDIFQ